MPIIEIFKAGKHQDANGQLVEITESDLNKMATHYAPKFHEAPIVIGHPETNAPAYGWVKGLKVQAGKLLAEVEATEELKTLMKNGHFKKVSASFYKPNNGINPTHKGFYLRHVGVLGAMPPAIKGMRDPVFNEQAAFFDFTFNEPQGETMDDTQAKLTEAQAKLAELEKTNQALTKANANLETEKNQLQATLDANLKAQTEKENADFAEGLIAQGKLTPAQKDQALALLNTEHNTADFSEGDFKGRLKAFLNGLHPVMDFNETATKEKAQGAEDESLNYAEGTNPASIEMDKKVRAYAKKHNCSYTDAFNALNH